MSIHYKVKNALKLSSYPIDMSCFLISKHWALDATGVPKDMSSDGYHPATIAEYALAQWNHYLSTNDERHLEAFMTQAYWLVGHETRIDADAGGWPIFFLHPDFPTNGPWLSASAQGTGISVALRAYQLTHEEVFLEIARRAVCTFKRDILDGGVSAPLGEGGIFFEEVATYPAAHLLNGFIVGLFGLYDYVAFTGDAELQTLILRSHATMHSLLDEFDLGFWTCSDLIRRRLASHSQIALQTKLLEVLAAYSECNHCSTYASRWKRYQCQFSSRLRYLIGSRSAGYSRTLWNRLRKVFLSRSEVSPVLRVCVPITAFPVTGGMRTVLAKIAQVTAGIWQLEYLTQHIGPHPQGFVIHRFGTANMFPSQFPNVWLYVLAGFWKLISLLRCGPGYQIILPQDGIFTLAFASLAARIAGVRCVCIDHGNLGLLKSRLYRAERIKALATRNRLYRLQARLRYLCYWPSLYLLAWFASHCVDHFLIPGAAGDGVEDICKRLGLHPSRITRFANMIDIHRHIIPDTESRASMREKNGISADAIVITMICRLTPEKGLEIALEAISQALSAVAPDQSARVRVIFAGDGPLRTQLEEEICLRGLKQVCLLWGEVSEETVISLLGLSDIFLFTSRRAAGYPLAILEAMASGCAVIASSEPVANSHMLAEGRGIVVPVGDIEQTSSALVQLLNDPALCQRMGGKARNYVATQHSPTMLRRALMRVTYWSALDTLLHGEMGSKT